MTETSQAVNAPNHMQGGAARLPVLVASFVVIASLALVALDRLFLPERFAIREVLVTGDAPNVDPAAVLETVRALGPRSWFSVDLAEVEEAVGTVPWVYRASVRRRWPGKLVVTVAQAEPFAHWNDERWINQAGEPLRLPRGFSGGALPDLEGPEGSAAEVSRRYLELAELFADHDPVAVRSLSMSARGSWRLGVARRGDEEDRRILITIGREQVIERASRLVAALRSGLGERLDTIAAFDLRYPNGFAVTFLGQAEAGVVQSPRQRSGNGTG